MSIRFSDVTNSAGIAFSPGLSFGSSWGDFNGDGFLDLYVSNHFSPITLYLNQQDGTFQDVAASQLPIQGRDTHSAQFVDFDNDGDQDIIQVVGAQSGLGSEPNLFFVNIGNGFIEQAGALGLQYAQGRSRTPLSLDIDNDGRLDFLFSNRSRPDQQAPSTIFRQTENNTFEDVGAEIGFNTPNSNFSVLADVSGDGVLDLIVGSGLLTIYDTTTPVLTDITSTLLPTNRAALDVTSADFNGDLLPDLYLTQNGLGSMGLFQDSANQVSASFSPFRGEQGAQFTTNGDGTVTFRLRPNVEVFIGANGFSPTGNTFTLSTTDPNVHGILPHTPGIDSGIYIGYNPDTQRWDFLVSTPGRTNLTAIIETDIAITQLDAVGFDPNRRPVDDVLLINTGNGFEDQSTASGITDISTAGRSVVSGDFDNDMDVDIYVVASGPADNRANILFDNQGDGTFLPVTDGGDVVGTTLGAIESVSTADYDLDGFLDFYVTTAEFPPLLILDGVDQLLRNQGNDNHWLQIDLEGIVSNRDGIGARIFATSGGVTQLREQNGGIHFQSQSQQRIHFGLADNTTVEQLDIHWPSGTIQRLENIPADQLLRVVEPSGPFAPGQPSFVPGVDEGVFIWKETFDGPYRLRTNGQGDTTIFGINLIASEALIEVSPVGLEPNDQLTTNDFGLSFRSAVINREDGIDFQLAPGAEALLSITQDGVANPRQLQVGGVGSRVAPTGWILNRDEFPERPSFTVGDDLGLFVGQGDSPEQLEFRWNGDGRFHRADVTVLAADSGPSFVPVSLDRGGPGRDTLTAFESGVNIVGGVGTLADGLNVVIPEPTLVGFSYQQDDLFQAHRVNPGEGSLGEPNAYELPVASPLGEPDYDAATDPGLFLWQDEVTGLWHLRAVAGGEANRYVGSIVASQAATTVVPVLLEPNDVLDTSDPLRIDFDLRVLGRGEDGINFQFPDHADVSIDLGQGADPLRIGAQQWPVSQVPLDLSGWT